MRFSSTAGLALLLLTACVPERIDFAPAVVATVSREGAPAAGMPVRLSLRQDTLCQAPQRRATANEAGRLRMMAVRSVSWFFVLAPRPRRVTQWQICTPTQAGGWVPAYRYRGAAYFPRLYECRIDAGPHAATGSCAREGTEAPEPSGTAERRAP